jgi:hypothetical protein
VKLFDPVNLFSGNARSVVHFSVLKKSLFNSAFSRVVAYFMLFVNLALSFVAFANFSLAGQMLQHSN